MAILQIKLNIDILLSFSQYSLLEKSLHLLDVKASAALGKMKTLFPSNQPADGIGQ